MKPNHTSFAAYSVLFAALYLFSGFLSPFSARAQSFCATTGGGDAIGYLGNGVAPPPNGPYYIRIHVYKVGNDMGLNFPTDEQIAESIAILKGDFTAFNIFFVWDCTIEEIRNNVIDSLGLVGMQQGPHPSCVLGDYVTESDGISVFIGGDTSNYCAVSVGIPGNAFLVKGLFSFGGQPGVTARSHIISHEMGHCLGLWHTHHGHEVHNDCNGNPVDDDQCDEWVDGSNNLSCGDYVEDTPADPGLDPGQIILNGCAYTGTLPDEHGDPYAPDPTLIMSSTHPNCMEGHTVGQGNRMRQIISTTDFLQDCLVEGDYSDLTITTNTPPGTTTFPSTTWDIANTPNGGEVLIDETLTIESGVTLTINADVKVRFGEQGKLIIKPNGRLVLGGTLTAMGCTQTWKGVRVWGNTYSSSQTQYPNTNGQLPQGRLEGLDKSLIENAETAAELYGPQFYHSGGQIGCAGTTFRNNKIGVVFAPTNNSYPFSSPPGFQGQPRPYKGYFTDCPFLVDAAYPHAERFDAFLKMEGVNGVSISGCSFTNNRPTEGVEVPDWGYGIHAVDAGFKVSGSSNFQYPQQINPTVFTNLGYGIYSGTAVYNRPYSVRDAVFSKCFVGLRNNRVTGATLIFNAFNLGAVPSTTLIPIGNNPLNETDQHQVGIVFENEISGFECQENMFTKVGNDPDIVTVGIMALATGGSSKAIRKNTFTGLTFGNVANGSNQFGLSGLLFACNENYSVVGKDIAIVHGTIKKTQGIEINNPPGAIMAAGNRFSYTNIDLSQLNNPPVFHRYDYGIGQNEEPLTIEGYFPRYPTIYSNSCQTDYCEPPCKTDSEIPQIKADYYSNVTIYQELLEDYEVSPTEQLEVELGYYRRILDEYTYMVVLHQMNDTSTYHIDTLRPWIESFHTLEAALWLSNLWLAEGNTAIAKQILDDAVLEYDLTTEQQTDLNQYEAIINAVAAQPIYALGDTVVASVRAFTEAGGFAEAWAKSILMANGDYYPPGFILESIEERTQENLQTGKKTRQGLVVRPNPADDFVSFDITSSFETATIRIFDITGTQITEISGISNQRITRWKPAIHAPGLFFYQMTIDGQSGPSGKIIFSN